MTLDLTELNPMWVPRAGGGAPTLRIALTAREADALVARAGVEATRAPTFDAPLALLADDATLAAQLTEAGVRVPRAAGTYAERQWDAREGVEEFAHRVFDHAELGTGVTDLGGLEARYAVISVAGTEHVRSVVAALFEVSTSGLVIDARTPHDLHVFALATLERGRCILVHADQIEERSFATDATALVDALVPGAR